MAKFDTDFLGPSVFPPVPLDVAIQQGMDTIRNNYEFKELRDEDGAFIQKWRDIEWSFENWEAQEVMPDKMWIREILDIYGTD